MKDLLDFDITSRPGAASRWSYRFIHRKRDIMVEFECRAQPAPADIPVILKDAFKVWIHAYTAASRKAMSPTQRTFYDGLVWFYKQEGRPPSYEEMAEQLGKKSKGTPHYYIRKLVELGWVWKDEKGRIIPCDIALPEGME